MRNRIKLFAGLSIMVLAFSACDLINPGEAIPARIQMEPVMLSVSPGQGSARHKITEVWVKSETDILGAFTPPVEIQYYTENVASIMTFSAGIRNNGILDDAIIYPFYSDLQVQLTTTAGHVSVVKPVFHYKPATTFSLISDFETQNEWTDNRDSFPATALTRSSADPFEGNFSGEIILTGEANVLEVANAIAINDLPVDGKPAYLEFHYKSEAAIEIGLLGIPLTGNSAAQYFYLLKPSETWNKIHIELTQWLEVSGFTSYKILLKAVYPPSSTQSQLRIQLDNIQVLHL